VCELSVFSINFTVTKSGSSGLSVSGPHRHWPGYARLLCTVPLLDGLIVTLKKILEEDKRNTVWSFNGFLQ